MGLLINKVKDKRTKFILGLMKEIVFLTIFIYLIFLASSGWKEGFMACRNNCICYQKVIGLDNFSQEIPEGCYKIGLQAFCPNKTINLTIENITIP